MTDERYKKIMADLGMPNSRSLLGALQQVANEAGQECAAAEREACARLCEERTDLKIATTYDWTRQVGQDLATAIRARANAKGKGRAGILARPA